LVALVVAGRRGKHRLDSVANLARQAFDQDCAFARAFCGEIGSPCDFTGFTESKRALGDFW
jgi:hypothetical protein